MLSSSADVTRKTGFLLEKPNALSCMAASDFIALMPQLQSQYQITPNPFLAHTLPQTSKLIVKRSFFLYFWHKLIKQSKISMLAEKSKLKKKSKYLKKPLQLKNNINETLAHNARAESILKKEIVKLLPCKPKKTTQERQNKLQALYDQVEVERRSDSGTQSSEEMLVADLQRREEDEECRDSRKDKRSMLFSHLVKDSHHFSRKLSVLQEKVNQTIKKYSVQSKIKARSIKGASLLPQQSCTFLPKAVQHSIARINDQNATEMRLSNMQITHLNLARIKEQIIFPGALRILDLSYNSLTSKSMGMIADLLSHNSLQQLSLKWNQLTYQGAMELLGAVTHNINLTSLDISYNKLTSTNHAFQDSLLKLLTFNKYLMHLNLEMCNISEQQCAVFAKAYNLTNESILCLHFKGNSHYYVNKLGYITKNRNHKDVPEASPPRELSIGRPDNLPNLCSKHLIGDDCCWLCQHWVGEMFRLPREIYPPGLIQQEKEIFIHLSCYDYMPIKLSNEECVNTMQPRKDCKRLQWSNYQVYLAQIPIPANRDIKYFFTSKDKIIINQNEPHVDANQMVLFEVFDVFGELCSNKQTSQKYSVFVPKMNTRGKESFGYNRQKKMKSEACTSNFRYAFKKENHNALKSILSKNKKMSTYSQANFKPLPRISKTKPNSPTHSRTQTTKMPHDTFNLVVNIRKCKEKRISAVQSEKYISLGMTPRDKKLLFNYTEFAGKDFTLDGDGTMQAELKRVQASYFGNCKESFISRFLRQRQQQKNLQPFMDRFKILTRRFFNSDQLFFSDIFSFLYSNFVSSGAPPEREQHAKQGGKNKTVKFEAPKETKLSILTNSERHLAGKIGTEAVSLGQQRKVQRRALSMNCISDKYQLTKLKAMPAGSIHTLQSNIPSEKTIKSIKELPGDHASLFQLSLENIPLPIDLTQDFFAHYSELLTRCARERHLIVQLMNNCERNCQKERIKELNELVVTYNYYRLTLFYEQTVSSGLKQIVFQAGSFTGLVNSVVNVETKPLKSLYLLQRKSSMLSGSQQSEPVLNLKALQGKISTYSAQDGLTSLAEYLRSQEHPIKIIARTESTQIMLKSSKKRKGRYGRSLKNIKEELIGSQTKVILPADSDKFMQDIQQEELNNQYNALVRQLNLLSDCLLEVLDQLVAYYLTGHSCGEERAIVEQWLKSHLTARIATFITDILEKCRLPGQMTRVRESSAQICQCFALDAVMQLSQASVMLGSSALQQNLKEYQFISPFHSYQFIIGIETTKLTNITQAIQKQPRILLQHVTGALRRLGESWKRHELQVVQRQIARKQAEANRKLKKIKTINESLERALPSEGLNKR